jgi:predicted HicB family RNase H-like nuclease
MKKPTPQKPKQNDFIKSAVRLPPELHAEVKDAAARNGHSLNDEIIARLRISPVEAKLNEVVVQGAEIKTLMRKILDKL